MQFATHLLTANACACAGRYSRILLIGARPTWPLIFLFNNNSTFATAASQNRFRSYKLSLHKKTNIVQKMTKNTRFFITFIIINEQWRNKIFFFFKEVFLGDFLIFVSYCIQHCFICRPSDSTVPTDVYMTHLLSFANIVLRCCRCKIHRYVAAPMPSCVSRPLQMFPQYQRHGDRVVVTLRDERTATIEPLPFPLHFSNEDKLRLRSARDSSCYSIYCTV